MRAGGDPKPGRLRELGNDAEALFETGFLRRVGLLAAVAMGARGALVDGDTSAAGHGEPHMPRAYALLKHEIGTRLALFGASTIDQRRIRIC